MDRRALKVMEAAQARLAEGGGIRPRHPTRPEREAGRPAPIADNPDTDALMTRVSRAAQ
jgi:hypothetical protein